MATETGDTGNEPSGFDAAVSAFDTMLSGDSQDTGNADTKAQRRSKPTAQAAPEKPDPNDDTDPDEGAGDGGEGADPDAAEGTGEDDGDPDAIEEGAEGADDQDDAADEQQGDADPIYAVTVDGEEVEVPLSELARGYIREASYTRKSQALASERQSFQGEVQQTRGLRDQYSRGLDQLAAVLEQLTPQEPDWDALRASDPQRYQTEWVDHQRRLQLRQNVDNERHAAEQQRLQDLQQTRSENISRGKVWLQQQVPEWKDNAKAKADRDAIRAYGLKMGFSEKDLKDIDDPRAILLLFKAMRHDRAAERKGQITSGVLRLVKPGEKKPAATQQQSAQAGQQKAPVLKPGTTKANSKLSRQTTELTRAKQRHAKVGTIKSAAEVFQKTFLG